MATISTNAWPEVRGSLEGNVYQRAAFNRENTVQGSHAFLLTKIRILRRKKDIF